MANQNRGSIVATQQSIKYKGKTLFLYLSYNFGSFRGIRSTDEINRTTTLLLHFTFSPCKGATSHMKHMKRGSFCNLSVFLIRNLNPSYS